MNKRSSEAAEQDYFAALIEADHQTVRKLLADDFLLIDVMTGPEVAKTALLEVGGRQCRSQSDGANERSR